MKSFFVFLGLLVAGIGQGQVIWDNTASSDSTSIRDVNDDPALQITNTNATDVLLSAVAFQGQNNADQTLNFFLADSFGNILAQQPVFELTTGPHSLVGATVNWTLSAGQTYFIGAATSLVGDNYDYGQGYPTQNGLVSSENGNFNGFSTPAFQGRAGADMTWQLQGNVVPEPCTIVATALGLAGIFVRRRRTA